MYVCKNLKHYQMASKKITDLLGDKTEYLLNHTCKTIDKSTITLPSPNHVDEIWKDSNRSNRVLYSLQALLDHGRLGGTGHRECGAHPFQSPHRCY